MKKNQSKVNPNKKLDQGIAIEVSRVYKTFRIPREKHTSLKSAAINLFNSSGYEVFKALDDVTFQVKRGEFFGIIGRNGSGKSTMLKILAGIYVTDRGKGSVEINGKLSPFLELGVGFNPELTGRENVFLGGAVLGLSKEEVSEKFDRIVAFAELSEFIDLKFKNYSSGMQVRLAFALAINARAEILLMDEVLAVGDSNFQSKCLEEFTRYKKQGKTVVLVSHDIGTIRRYSDRVMLLNKGKIIKIGSPKEVTDEYLTQNMSDLERADRDTTEKRVPKDSKKPHITKVEYLDKRGERRTNFKTHEDVIVRVYFEASKEYILNFGLALFDTDEKYILGINTFTDKIDTTFRNKYFEVHYKNIPLRTGVYYCKAGIWGDNVSKQYDFMDSENRFKIFAEDDNEGLVAIDYEWSNE